MNSHLAAANCWWKQNGPCDGPAAIACPCDSLRHSEECPAPAPAPAPALASAGAAAAAVADAAAVVLGHAYVADAFAAAAAAVAAVAAAPAVAVAAAASHKVTSHVIAWEATSDPAADAGGVMSVHAVDAATEVDGRTGGCWGAESRADSACSSLRPERSC